MSRVVVATAFGGPEVLSVVDEEVGSPGPGEVLVDIEAAGVNPADVKMYNGMFGTDPSRLPLRLGFEASGVVTEVGDDATGPVGPISVGNEVIIFRVSGAYADRLVVAGSAVVPKPAGMDWAEAAGLMLTGATAIHTLIATNVSAGDTLVVHGASGGVGLMVVQLAALRGARVIATASSRNHARLRELGAEPVKYGDGLTERVRALAPGGVTAAIDLIGTNEAIDASLELVGDRNRIASIAAFKRGGEEGLKLLGSGPGADPGTDIRAAARLELVDLVSAGKLDVMVAARYPLDEVADAHREILTGHTSGKIVLVP
jgi:NADPH2:quinone reductase